MNLKLAWFATLILLLVPTGLLVWNAQLYSPLVAFLVSMAQLYLALVIGSLQSAEQARRSANAKWLPPAESACDRLLTVKASVLGLQQQTKGACHEAANDLPELKADQNKAIRMVFERYCSEISSRLIDVQNHLEGAFEDWIRFIRQNCEGSECQRIWTTLMLRKAGLALNTKSEICGATAAEATTSPTTSNPSPITVVVSGADDGVDGIHSLQGDGRVWRSPRFLLHKWYLGWSITDLETGESRFSKQSAPGDDTPRGDYLPCPACKGGGVATVG